MSSKIYNPALTYGMVIISYYGNRLPDLVLDALTAEGTNPRCHSFVMTCKEVEWRPTATETIQVGNAFLEKLFENISSFMDGQTQDHWFFELDSPDGEARWVISDNLKSEINPQDFDEFVINIVVEVLDGDDLKPEDEGFNKAGWRCTSAHRHPWPHHERGAHPVDALVSVWREIE